MTSHRGAPAWRPPDERDQARAGCQAPEAKAEPLDLAEKLYLLEADKMLMLKTFNRLSQELSCSDCRHALVAAKLVLKHLVRPRLPKEPGLGAAATAITERIRELGFDAEAEDVATNVPRGNA